MDYSKTVNLLQTAFPMKADLPLREPEMLKRWAESGLYSKIQANGEEKPVFLLHDGPPYANGAIHIGHALNKILKDFVIKYKTLAGFRSPYVPGWDCHGLPIEHQLFKTLGKNKHQVSRIEIRQKAAEYALGFVEKQRDDFKRLGILGEWENPYLTLSKEYEAGIVKTLFELKDNGFIYRGLKPGYWCAFDETALAEAEVEYADKKSDSVYVKFDVDLDSIPPSIRSKIKTNTLNVAVWTTTPWTLPANVALALHPDEKYGVLSDGKSSSICALKLLEKMTKFMTGFERSVGIEFKGSELLGSRANNPLNGNPSKIVTAGFVTMEDGTGIVHIAPGHGVEDFSVGLQYKLTVLSPVDERGCFDAQVRPADLVGKHVLKDANAAVIDLLKTTQHLIEHQPFQHSYPHCWRCKNPIIFRATEQWFLGVPTEFRKRLLDSIDQVKWEPSYGVHRIKGMVEQRPDWCLSRQRHWGAPIAVFYCESKACAEVLWDKALNLKLIELLRKEGASFYYEKSETELFKILGFSPKCAKCGGNTFRKEMDILDVWFDSGVSWSTVVEERLSQKKPETVMYLEGSDQHRGWFQTSLIPSVALRGKAPYDIVLTHGFVVDGKGHKMSKSTGNVVSPQEVIQKYGADVLRLWVAMSDYREDVRVSQDIIKHLVDVYRRFRNTFRFLLQNTSDFNYAKDRVAFSAMEEVDRWVLMHFEEVKKTVLKAYDSYEFHVVLSELNRFVAVELSGFYLDALKDRLYCEAPASPLRRSTQTALFELARGLFVLLAPVLSFTSEEAYLELRKASHSSLPESVFLDSLSDLAPVPIDAPLKEKWAQIFKFRSMVNDELDRRRKEGVLKSSQEASVQVTVSKLDPVLQSLFQKQKEDWPFLLQAAEATFIQTEAESPVVLKATSYAKCERCWRHRADVGSSTDHSTLCGRCLKAVAAHPAAV